MTSSGLLCLTMSLPIVGLMSLTPASKRRLANTAATLMILSALIVFSVVMCYTLQRAVEVRNGKPTQKFSKLHSVPKLCDALQFESYTHWCLNFTSENQNFLIFWLIDLGQAIFTGFAASGIGMASGLIILMSGASKISSRISINCFLIFDSNWYGSLDHRRRLQAQ